MNGVLDRLAQRWLDRPARRSPRLAGFSVDDGVAGRGDRYGGVGTIHNTGTIDVVMTDGRVTEVWFRCMALAFSVSDPKGHPVYSGDGARVVAIEVER